MHSQADARVGWTSQRIGLSLAERGPSIPFATNDRVPRVPLRIVPLHPNSELILIEELGLPRAIAVDKFNGGVFSRYPLVVFCINGFEPGVSIVPFESVGLGGVGSERRRISECGHRRG